MDREKQEAEGGASELLVSEPTMNHRDRKPCLPLCWGTVWSGTAVGAVGTLQPRGCQRVQTAVVMSPCALGRSVHLLPVPFADPGAAVLLLPTWNTAALLPFLLFHFKKRFQAISNTPPDPPCKWLWFLETDFPSRGAQTLPQSGRERG